jgi:uncharacterized protein (DUF1697 family)
VNPHVVLLRGVNVGGHNKVPMADLRKLLSERGHQEVRSYVQSGNVVLRSPATSPEVAAAVRELLAKEFGLDIVVIVRGGLELAEVAAHNPFLRPDADPARQLHVAFLERSPDPGRAAGLDPHRAPPDELHLRGREIYLWCPDGLGRSKVFNGLERLLGTPATVRNWRTVGELLRLTSQLT